MHEESDDQVELSEEYLEIKDWAEALDDWETAVLSADPYELCEWANSFEIPEDRHDDYFDMVTQAMANHAGEISDKLYVDACPPENWQTQWACSRHVHRAIPGHWYDVYCFLTDKQLSELQAE